MKKQLLRLSPLLLAGWALGAHAQTIWTYEIIGPDNKAKITRTPASDISYPPANAPASIYDPNAPRGIVMTSREEAARLSAPMLIIILVYGYSLTIERLNHLIAKSLNH